VNCYVFYSGDFGFMKQKDGNWIKLESNQSELQSPTSMFITRGADNIFQQLVPSAKGQARTTIGEAGHFFQEDRSKEFLKVILDFIKV
jgi:hypothetical protein